MKYEQKSVNCEGEIHSIKFQSGWTLTFPPTLLEISHVILKLLFDEEKMYFNLQNPFKNIFQ